MRLTGSYLGATVRETEAFRGRHGAEGGGARRGVAGCWRGSGAGRGSRRSARVRRASAIRTSRSTATAATTSRTTTSTSSTTRRPTYSAVWRRIDAKAKQNLSSFNLDLVGMNVRAVFVDGDPARWRRDGDELDDHAAQRPAQRPRLQRRVIAYDGVPEIGDPSRRPGFIHTDDGTLVAGQPRRGGELVPGQRPPARQGLLHVPDRGPARPAGDRQRRAGGRGQPRAAGPCGRGTRASRWRRI